MTDPWRTLRWAVATAVGLDTDLEPPVRTDNATPWQDTMRLARRHEVVTLAATGLRTISDGPAATRMDAVRARSMTKALAQAADTKDLLLALERAGVGCLVLKGLPLSVHALGALHLRDTGDVDVLVRPSDREAAEAALAGLGYSRVAHPEIPAHGFPTRPDPVQSGFAYRAADRTTVVDLHWRLAATDGLAGLSANEAIAASVPIEVGGMDVRTLLRDEHYLFVVAHAAKHRFSRLKWLVDIAALRRSVDATRVQAEAASRGHTRMHEVADSLIVDLLVGRPSPPTWPRLTATALAALTGEQRIANDRVIDRERYLLGLYRGIRPRSHMVAWRARRGIHSLRWSA